MSIPISRPNTPISFTAPGAGSWLLDTTHHGNRPITKFMWPLQKQAFESGMARMMKRYGLPLAGALMRNVHGLGYIRILAVGENPDSAGSPPPLPILKLLTRIHPELRRRNKTAKAALAEKAWRHDVAWWFDEQRNHAIAANLALQQVELGSLSDQQLAEHMDALIDNFTALSVESFANHGGDLIPVGLFLNACKGWGIEAAEASALLRGASPATRENQCLLAPVAEAISQAPKQPNSVEEVRSLGEPANTAINRWLDLNGWRLLSSDDIDAKTLAELPDLQLRALLAAGERVLEVETPDSGDLRSKVPAALQGQFDEALAEARHGLTQRDDAVGIAWNWPAGLIRRGLLEVGKRLVERGHAQAVEHAVELASHEVPEVLAGRGPTAPELAERRALRDWIEISEPPPNLGPEAEPPPLDAFPAPLATMAGAVLSIIDAMEPPISEDELRGNGIGTDRYRGRACVVQSPIDAFEHLQQGDVLVVPFTSPSYDSVLPMVGAIVTDHGGPMSHTAIMAREFGIPAVVGIGNATANIRHGAMIEVDPSSASVYPVT